MSQPVEAPPQTASSGELREALARALNSHFGVERAIVRLERRPAAKRSSFALEELDLRLDDGAELRLIFKNLSRHALLEGALHVKPAFLHDPLREIEMYRRILAPDRMGTAVYYGTAVDPRAERYWLFLEKVAGLELYQVGEFATWQKVARNLAVMHTQFTRTAECLSNAQTAHLLTYNADYFRLWFGRAQEFLQAARPSRRRKAKLLMERLAPRYEQVIERLVALPATLIHGEFYASNVLVRENADGLRVCPVDWEMAGVGPGLLDLAALTAGRWTDEQKTVLALSYHAALPQDHTWSPRPDALLGALDYCHLHLAMQWLGWSPDWSPPPEHRRNWLRDALRVAEKLGW
jgi:thiamine kinase-like enzyme